MKRVINTKFYTFDQNNSGGRFHNDENLAQLVIIEAISDGDANDRAEKLGIYFDGVDGGSDCQSCGDRWSRVYKDDGHDKPMHYNHEVTEDYQPLYQMDTRYPYAYIHYMDGTKTIIKGKQE